MSTAASDQLASLPLRLLCVAPCEPRWTQFVLQLDGPSQGGLRIHWVSDAGTALAELRTGCFDALLVDAASSDNAYGPVELVDVVHTLHADAAVVMLLPLPEDHLLSELYRRDCDICVSPRMWDSPALPAVVQGAIRRRQCRVEFQRLTASHQRRIAREQADAESMLRLQQELLQGLKTEAQLATNAAETPSLHERYDDLLKACILSGTQRLGGLLDDFVRELLACQQSPAELLAMHIDRVSAISLGTGGRASQHLVARANLLALELLARLGEGYRRHATMTSPVRIQG